MSNWKKVTTAWMRETEKAGRLKLISLRASGSRGPFAMLPSDVDGERLQELWQGVLDNNGISGAEILAMEFDLASWSYCCVLGHPEWGAGPMESLLPLQVRADGTIENIPDALLSPMEVA